jgi:putative endonuclease
LTGDDRVDAMPGGWVYIMTNRPNGTLYVGTTTNLARRVWEHREGVADGFTKRYGLTRLIYAERHDDILAAKQREMNIKHWSRAWKVRLILKENAAWDDLYAKIICPWRGVDGRAKPGQGVLWKRV